MRANSLTKESDCLVGSVSQDVVQSHPVAVDLNHLAVDVKVPADLVVLVAVEVIPSRLSVMLPRTLLAVYLVAWFGTVLSG